MIKKLKIICSMFLCVMCMLCMFPARRVEASGIHNADAFDRLEGDAQYLSAAYKDNYYLDMEKVGIMEPQFIAINFIANLLFCIITKLADIVCHIFYYSMDFDIVNMFSGQINGIQSALNKSIFKPLFNLACCGTSFMMLKRVLKRDMAGAYTEIIKVVLIVVASMLVINKSDAMLSAATSITKEVSVQSLASLNEGMGVTDSRTNFAAKGAGILWVNLVHDPWKTFEFGNEAGDVSEAQIREFLTCDPKENAAGRQALVENSGLHCFSKFVVVSKVSLICVYFVPFAIKCLVFSSIALLQLCFQLEAVFFVVLTPIILLLALLPGYDVDIITLWLHKILETQISILLITFVMGILIRVDELLYAFGDSLGWLIVMIFQTALYIGVFMARHKIVHLLSGAQRGLSNARMMRTSLQRGGNLYMGMENAGRMQRTNRKKAKRKIAAIGSKIDRIGNRLNVQKPASASGTAGGSQASDTDAAKSPVSAAAPPEATAQSTENEQRPVSYMGNGYDSSREILLSRGLLDTQHDIGVKEQKSNSAQAAMPHRNAEGKTADDSASYTSVKRPRMDVVIDPEQPERSVVFTEAGVEAERYMSYMGSGYDSSREILQAQGLWNTQYDVGAREQEYGKPLTVEAPEKQPKKAVPERNRRAAHSGKDMNTRRIQISNAAQQSFERANQYNMTMSKKTIRTDGKGE